MFIYEIIKPIRVKKISNESIPIPSLLDYTLIVTKAF
jgi:hypothetical protein